MVKSHAAQMQMDLWRNRIEFKFQTELTTKLELDTKHLHAPVLIVEAVTSVYDALSVLPQCQLRARVCQNQRLVQ